MRLQRTRLTTLFAVLALSCPHPSQAQTTLRYQFKEGDTLRYQSDAKSVGTATIGGEVLKRENNYLVDTLWTLKGVDKEGRARFTQKVERIRLKADYLGLPIDYDTQAPNEPEGVVKKLVAKFKEAVGQEITFTMDRRGRRSEASVPVGLRSMASSGGVLAFAEFSGVVLPERPVKKGDTWKVEDVSESDGDKAKRTLHFTYEGALERDGRTLEKLAFKREPRNEKERGEQTMAKTTKDEGEVYFDNGAGRVVEVRLRQKFAPSSGKVLVEQGESAMTVRLIAK